MTILFIAEYSITPSFALKIGAIAMASMFLILMVFRSVMKASPSHEEDELFYE
ncbi:MAG: hypothetical protein ACI81T_004366 [Bacteroidia bacterium]|jgi:hypothetical protein